MFRPDELSRPRWVGNLKQYKFSYNSSSQQVTLVDAAGSGVVNPTTGFIVPDAKSIWTSSSPYSDFWKNKTWANEPNIGGASDYPDGQLVEKGGVAQKLRSAYISSQASRTIYTCTSCSNSLTAFDTNLGPSVFGLTTTTDRDSLVNWVRGRDNLGDEFGPGTVTPTAGGAAVTANVRPTIHGDVVHSSPAIINYGGSTGSVAFYGANDGLFRAVNANVSGTSAGMELWAFVPEEMLPRLSRLRNNDPIIKFASTNTTAFPTATRREWGVDGPVTFYQKLSSPTRAIVYFGLRRGGRGLYAMDVGNPSSPSLLWKFTDTDLGQTWSEPRVTRVANYTNPVIVMGGGYDADAEDLGAAQSMGNKVYIIDALTGALVQKFGNIDRSVPGGVALYDSDGDGRTDRLYFGDLGGNVYRIDLAGGNAAAWGPTKKIAALGDAAGAKIFYAPALTQAGSNVAIQFGTGDREKPLQSTGTMNRFFTVYDKGQTSAIGLSDLTSMTTAGLSSVPADSYGCYMTLPNAGEKVVSGVAYASGFSFFGTNGPAPANAATCTGSMGVARSYAVSAFCGPSLISTLVGGGFPPTPVIATVLIAPSDNPNVDCTANPAACSRVPVGIGAAPPDCAGNASVLKSSFGASNIYACAPNQRQRRGWNFKNPR
jgi:type IV pilus assembly protein PilY1